MRIRRGDRDQPVLPLWAVAPVRLAAAPKRPRRMRRPLTTREPALAHLAPAPAVPRDPEHRVDAVRLIAHGADIGTVADEIGGRDVGVDLESLRESMRVWSVHWPY